MKEIAAIENKIKQEKESRVGMDGERDAMLKQLEELKKEN
jgi:hypothetical protein